MASRGRAWLLAALLGLASVPAQALPAALGDWQALGQGQMRWLGLSLYQATLYTPQRQPFDWSRPFALSLRYARDIPAARIVAVSLDEMQRFGLPPERRASWHTALSAAIPDVAEGDEIVGVLAGSRLQFWHNNRLTYSVDDALLARTFFRIWLDPATREPALRAQLLGAAP